MQKFQKSAIITLTLVHLFVGSFRVEEVFVVGRVLPEQQSDGT
jgi:hypothetical protein